MKVSEPDEQDVNDMLDDEEDDGVVSAEIEEDESDPYELTDEEIAELADEEDEPEDDDEQHGTEPPDEGEASESDGEDGESSGEDGDTGEGEAASDADATSSQATEPNASEGEKSAGGEATDYAKMAADDLAVINRAFPGMNVTDLRKIDNPGRYGALRDLGLSPEEAFRATNHVRISEQVAASARARVDGKSHIRSDMPAKSGSAEGFSLSAAQLREARELFPGKSDKEITALYRSVSR